MKILKKNQLIILVISLMLMTAGYLNFTSQDVEKENLATYLLQKIKKKIIMKII